MIFICTLPHPTEGRAEDLPTEAWICIAIYSTGLSYCVVWVGRLCKANLIQVTSSSSDTLHSSSWSCLSVWMLNFMYWGLWKNTRCLVELVLEKYCLWMRTEWVIERFLAHGFESDISAIICDCICAFETYHCVCSFTQILHL